MAESTGLEGAMQASSVESSPRPVRRWGVDMSLGLGVVYTFNIGYHLIQASVYHGRFEEQHRWESILKLDLYTQDKHAETLAQYNYHLTKAWNPFYSTGE